MAVVTSAVLGALTSLAPEVIGIFRAKVDLNHEREMRKMELEGDFQEQAHEKRLADLRADIEEGKSLRQHDSTLNGGKFINGLRASVRPVITYLFFAVFVFIKLVGVYLIFQGNGGYVDLSIAWTEVYPEVWGMDEKSIFAAIMGFWFGSRAIDQAKRRELGRRVSVR